MKKALTITMTGIFLFAAAAFALTLDEAKTHIDKQATDRNLSATDHSQAITTLQGLVDKGVPVEQANRVVEESINHNIKGKDLAAVTKSVVETRTDARKEAATVAADAIQHKYTARETVQMTNTFGKTVTAGAPPDKTSQVMSNGISKGVGAGSITTAMNGFSAEIRSGASPDRAAAAATQAMDRGATMQQDRDMSRDHMGAGAGMDHGGMDHGAGMGPGAGPGMGGSRR